MDALETKETKETIEVNMNNIKIDIGKFNKMNFIYNALESGWAICKSNDKYIFTKKHKGQEEVFKESYLSKFIKDNLNIKTFLYK